jgi:gamma-glutamylcyclotransferase (GGCT)/AIG2-like uncharacterized protein YtfP
LQAVTGKRFARRPARLAGYRRVVGSHGYPDLVASPGSEVDGFLIDDVDPASLRALDTYEDEGRLYRRQPVRVRVEGALVDCDVYIGLHAS